MIVETLIILVLLSCGACSSEVRDISSLHSGCDLLTVTTWDDFDAFPISVMPLYQDSDYLSGYASSIINYRTSFKLDHIHYRYAGTVNNALNFLSTRLIL